MQNVLLGKLGRGLEFTSIAAGLVLGTVFLDPMSLNTAKDDLRKVAAPAQMQTFNQTAPIGEPKIVDGVLKGKQYAKDHLKVFDI